MNYNWENIKWIFKSDWTLRDIYVQNTSKEDWGKLIDLLNSEYEIKYFSENKINKEKVYQYFADETGEVESSTITIQLENIKINCHYFFIEQIEFNIAPSEIKTDLDFKKILSFMRKISTVLKKQITLTAENEPKFPLIKIFEKENIFKILTETEITEYYKVNHFDIKSLISSLKFKFLMFFFPKFIENKLIKSANEIAKATKLEENLW